MYYGVHKSILIKRAKIDSSVIIGNVFTGEKLRSFDRQIDFSDKYNEQLEFVLSESVCAAG